MAFKCGFFNSINLDRGYNNQDISKIFDGIINDGVYASEGNMLTVKASGEGMNVYVDTGRAWFNHTWSYNDALYSLQIKRASMVLDRIDAVVLEINHTLNVRNNFLKVVTGEPSIDPQRPTLIKDEENDIYQYPLGYIYVKTGTDKITQEDVTNMIGTEECPFVTGIIQTADIDNLISQWSNQWTNWLEKEKVSAVQEFEGFIQGLQDVLDEDTAGHLQNEIDHLYETMAYINRNDTADKDYTSARLIIWRDRLYMTTKAIEQGEALEVGENLELYKFSEYIDKTNSFGTFYIDRNKWSTETISTNAGEALYYNVINVNGFYNPSGFYVLVGATPAVEDLPNEYERAAAALIEYAVGDDEDLTITLYAKQVPEDSFYLAFEGVE